MELKHHDPNTSPPLPLRIELTEILGLNPFFCYNLTSSAKNVGANCGKQLFFPGISLAVMNFKTPGILYKKNDDTLKTEVIVNRLRHNVFGVTLTDNFQYQQ